MSSSANIFHSKIIEKFFIGKGLILHNYLNCNLPAFELKTKKKIADKYRFFFMDQYREYPGKRFPCIYGSWSWEDFKFILAYFFRSQISY